MTYTKNSNSFHLLAFDMNKLSTEKATELQTFWAMTNCDTVILFKPFMAEVNPAEQTSCNCI